MNGILLIDKPIGFTSHDVVAKLRRKLDLKKIGHAGTLDPLATGLLILLIGNATKVSQYITDQDKSYEGEFILGIETDSYDAEGKIVAEKEVHCTTQDVRGIIPKFLGKQQQLPPMFSAKKVDGRPLYKLARAGQVIERKAHEVTIFDLKFPSIELPKISFEVSCTKGTYIRSLAHDIGESLGCGAYLSKLRRTKTGKMNLSEALPLDRVIDMELVDIEKILLPITDIL